MFMTLSPIYTRDFLLCLEHYVCLESSWYQDLFGTEISCFLNISPELWVLSSPCTTWYHWIYIVSYIVSSLFTYLIWKFPVYSLYMLVILKLLTVAVHVLSNRLCYRFNRCNRCKRCYTVTGVTLWSRIPSTRWSRLLLPITWNITDKDYLVLQKVKRYVTLIMKHNCPCMTL